MEPLARIHPVERLVEDQDGRLVDQRRRHLHPLAHPLRVRPDRAVRRRQHVDHVERAFGGAGDVGEPLERGRQPDEFAPGQVR